MAVQEMQPDIANGGRADSIAVNPANNDILIVASESGGLFRSTDRGLTWTHLDGFPTFWTRGAVMFFDANIVIATAVADFKTTNGGGIYRSTDGGISWTQAVSPPPPTGSTAFYEAREISIAPDTRTIYVATSYGVAKSIDRGATWTHSDPFGANSDLVQSVLALTNGVILAGSPAGLRRSTDHGGTWVVPATATTGPINDRNTHAFARSPFYSDHAYMVNGNKQLFFTTNGGNNWTQIPNAPADDGGGIGFVKAQAIRGTPQKIVLWLSDRRYLYRQTATEVQSRVFDHSGNWTRVAVDHDDMRDLAFDTLGNPLLLGTDGGLHNTIDGGANWRFVGGGRCGFNALQITEVKGQRVRDRFRHDLYFGTQDNSLWASGDGGVTWTNPLNWEGFYIEAEKEIAREADSRVSAVACGPCSNRLTDALFTNQRAWANAQTPTAGNPVVIGPSRHVSTATANPAFAPPFTEGYALTTNLGASWSQSAALPETKLSIPRLANDFGPPVLYQAIRVGMQVNGIQIDKLARTAFPAPNQPPVVTYPAMNGFGGLGINPTMFAWYEVFGIDSADSRHLIAPDVINNRMMETFDAGDNWSEIPALTSLVTDNGRYMFARRRDNTVMHSNATVVSFNREKPDFVAVGTMQGGVLLSTDRGRNWFRVPGSERAPFITSIEWKSVNEAVVSSYGRGLWRLKLHWLLPLDKTRPYCAGLCIDLPFKPAVSDPPIIIIIVLNGQIQGGTASSGSLRELFVTPGSGVVLYTDNAAATDSLVITESSKAVGWTGVTPPDAPDGQEMVGLSLTKSAKPINGMFTKEPLESYTPTEKELIQDMEPIGNPKSPTAGKPYLSLNLPPANMTLPAAPLNVTGRNFTPAATVELTIDDQPVAKVKTSDTGGLAVTLTAPRGEGVHSVKVLDANRKLIDGAVFVVTHKEGDDD